MSSALRTVSQIEPTVKFLRAVVADASGTYTVVTPAAMTTFLTANENIESLTGINTIAESASSPVTSLTSVVLARDLGRKVTVVSPAAGNLVRQVWVSAQAVADDTTEGVAGTEFWVRTFAAEGTADAQWVRLG
jgi:hypothetical protein